MATVDATVAACRRTPQTWHKPQSVSRSICWQPGALYRALPHVQQWSRHRAANPLLGEDAGCPRRASVGRHRRQQAVLSFVLLVASVASLTGLVACDLGPTTVTPPDQTLPQVRHLEHRGPVTVVFVPEASPSYDQTVYTAAITYMAASLEAVVRENADSFTFMVTFADEAPLLPESSPLTVTIPALPAYPPAPQLQPTPQPTGNPYKDAQAAQRVEQANAALLRDYRTAIEQVNQQVEQARQAIAPQVQQLRTLRPPANLSGGNVSIWGAVVVAAQRFSTIPTGTKILVLASTMDEKTWIDKVPESLGGLRGSDVWVLFYQCAHAQFCDYKRSTWHSVFAGAGVASEHWLDPGQSASLPPLFGEGRS